MWTTVCPEQVGDYWFYGWLDASRREAGDLPYLHWLSVCDGTDGLGHPKLVYHVQLAFVNPQRISGWFCAANIPPLPDALR